MALPLMMRAVIVPTYRRAVPTYRARDLQLLPGASDDRLPSRAPHIWPRIAKEQP
jgi:hypothetical protein